MAFEAVAGPGDFNPQFGLVVDRSSAPQPQAWFRVTDPGEAGPSDTSYLLRIDCAARFDEPAVYEAPAQLSLNTWGLTGTWTVAGSLGWKRTKAPEPAAPPG